MRNFIIASAFVLASTAAALAAPGGSNMPGNTSSGSISGGFTGSLTTSVTGQWGSEAGGTLAGGSANVGTTASAHGTAFSAGVGGSTIADVGGSLTPISGDVTVSSYNTSGNATPGASFTSSVDAFSEGSSKVSIKNTNYGNFSLEGSSNSNDYGFGG
jgi:hypothetical protein